MDDIQDRKDIELMVVVFYEKVRADQLLAPVFSHVDWPKHLPVMFNFWSSLLLGDKSYDGNPFQKHMGLAIGREHFDRWLQLFHQTIDEHFTGFKAEEVKDRARSIAGVFQHKLGLMR